MGSGQVSPLKGLAFVLFGLLLIAIGGYYLYQSTHDAYDYRVEKEYPPSSLSDYEQDLVVHDFSNLSADGQRVFLAAKNASSEYTIYRASNVPPDLSYAEDDVDYGGGICFVVYDGEYYRVTGIHDWAGVGAFIGSIGAGVVVLLGTLSIGYGGTHLGYHPWRVMSILLAALAGVLVPVLLNWQGRIVVTEPMYPWLSFGGTFVPAAVVWYLVRPARPD